ncbi:hypothetical protein ACFV98_39680 [Streptomyces violascens]|uniref:hypothetical protein n=1 Tax=Streptomyces violascens TaxID=67381 RepID=UPI003659D854
MAGRPGRGSAATGRPRGSGDMVPSDQLPAKVAELLDADPAVTIATVTDTLGIAYATAQRALTRLRGERLADRMEARPEASAGEAAAELGYPVVLHRAVSEAAEAVRRARAVRPYVQRSPTTWPRTAGWSRPKWKSSCWRADIRRPPSRSQPPRRPAGCRCWRGMTGGGGGPRRAGVTRWARTPGSRPRAMDPLPRTHPAARAGRPGQGTRRPAPGI